MAPSIVRTHNDWSLGNRKPRWVKYLPDPAKDFNVQYEVNTGQPHIWMGWDVVAADLFVSSLWGAIYDYSTVDGTLKRIISPGPEIEGSAAWEDAAQGLRAVRRANGEIALVQENSGFDAKCNFYRLPPSGTNLPPRVRIVTPAATNQIAIVNPTDKITVTASAVDDDGLIAKVDFYNGSTLIGTATTAPYVTSWNDLPVGTYTLTAVATDDQGATTTSAPVTVVSAPTNPTYATWVAQNGLTGNNALPTAIIANDDLNNLFKYALGLIPTTNYNPGSAGLPYVAVQNVSGTNYLTLTFTGVATDVTYKVQATSSLSGGWTTIQTFPSGSTAPGTVTVQDTQAIGISAQRYMRLYMTNP